MSLTPQNMETMDGRVSHTIYRDIGRMDEEQLERYLRAVFTGKSDLGFLPAPFWDYHFDMDRHGDTTDGRDAPSPAHFFSGMHDTLGNVATGGFKIGHDGDEDPDFGYRPRFRRIIRRFLDESFQLKGKPTAEQKRLAAFAVEATGAIMSIDSFMASNRHSSLRSKEGSRVSVEYPQYLIDDLGDLGEEKMIMIGLAEAIIRSKRFGDLKLRYDSPVHLR